MTTKLNETYGYVPIIKSVKQEDGTLMVYGNATDDSLDLDSQVCDSKWLETAMPDWFMSGGNIREMHTASAVGKAQEYENKAGEHIIGTLIVDPVAILKVDTGVYQGFSIGIKNPQVIKDTTGKAINGRIVGGSIIEVSLVDRPANPNAKLIMAKSVNGDSTLTKVSEFHDFNPEVPLPSEVFKNTKAKTEKGSTKMETLKQITELVKSLTPDTVKTFDMTELNAALKAIAQLIIQEATELAEGSDEQASLNALISAVSNIFEWYKGEVAEGEVEGVTLEYKEETYWMEAVQEAVKSVMIKSVPSINPVEEVIVETVPAVEHVAPVVDAPITQVVVEEPVVTEVVAVEPVVEVSESVEPVAPVAVEAEETPDVKSLVEEAVKSALGEMKSEITASFESAIKAVESDNTKLKSELETALNKVASGGAKRTATKMSDKSQNDNLVKADEYERKAAATTDKKLAEGYRDIAKELRAESKSN